MKGVVWAVGCSSRAGEEHKEQGQDGRGRNRSLKEHKLPCLEPDAHREGLAGAALGQENEL